MPRPRRSFEAATSYHVTMRCNIQAFDLRRPCHHFAYARRQIIAHLIDPEV